MSVEYQNIHDFRRALLRRKKVGIRSFAAFLVLVIAFAFLFPPTYRSTGIVQLRLPGIKQDVLATALQQNGSDPAAVAAERANEQIQLIAQRVLARKSLSDIITRFNLYADMRETHPMEEVVAKMQKKIKLVQDDTGSLMTSPTAGSSAIAFDLSFDYEDPLIAQQVATELIQRFIKDHSADLQGQAQETSTFLAGQIHALEETLGEQEARISAFKLENPGVGSDSLAFNMQMLATSAQTIGTLTEQLKALQIQRGNIAAQLANVDPYSRVIDVPLGYQQNLQATHILTSPRVELKALRSKLAELEGQYGPNYPDIVQLRHKIAAIENGIDPSVVGSDLQSLITDARTKLDIAKETYGPNHPDVRALQNKLDRLIIRQRQIGNGASFDQMHSDADNPSYLVVKYQLESIDSSTRSLEQQLAAAKAQQALYQQHVNATPEFDKKLAALSRDYENAQERYKDLKEKKLSADMEVEVHRTQKGEQLIVVESPDLPLKPHFPPRAIVLALGLVTSVFAGIGGALASDMMGNEIFGTAELLRVSRVPVLVAVPQLYSSADLRQRRRRRNMTWISAGLLVIVLILVAGFLLFDTSAPASIPR